MMEGISHEVCSLAGTLKLGKLIAFYDDNGISIDGHVEGWFTDDTAMRFEAYGWHVIRDIDGHDAASIKRAVEEARAVTDKPSLLMCKTIIGFGSPNKAGTHDSHGAPLGDAEIALTREQLAGNTRRSKSRLKSMLSGMRKKQARRKNPHGTRNSLLTRKLIRRKPLNLPAV